MSKIQEFYKMYKSLNWKTCRFTSEKCKYATFLFWKIMICSGFKFDPNELVELGKWSEESCHNSYQEPDERHYTIAVSDSNISFCLAYEKLKGRKPFIVKGIDYPSRAGLVVHMNKKTQGRLTLGSRFSWKGFMVEVTSFKDGEGSLTACAYDEIKDERGYRINNKPIKRFTITNDMLNKEKRDSHESYNNN